MKCLNLFGRGLTFTTSFPSGKAVYLWSINCCTLALKAMQSSTECPSDPAWYPNCTFGSYPCGKDCGTDLRGLGPTSEVWDPILSMIVLVSSFSSSWEFPRDSLSLVWLLEASWIFSTFEATLDAFSHYHQVREAWWYIAYHHFEVWSLQGIHEHAA